MKRKSSKRFGAIATLTAAALIAQSVGIVYANDNANTQDTTLSTGFVSLGDHTPGVLYDENAPKTYSARSNASSSYYITPNLPSVKDQGSYGTCWAFATLACAEANLMAQGYTDADLSEMHLSYFAYNFVDDELKGLTGDDHSFTGSSVLGMGGNYIFAANALSDWRGAADESLAPYDTATANTIEGSGLSDSLAYNDVVHLENFYYISNESQDDIKQAIVNYGAVGVCYYAYGDYSSNQYYNSETAGYYCNSSQQANHAVTIVGWDDSYSASNFPSRPSGDGAWIVQNSWGEAYGDNGYFYLSYYDKSIDTLLLAVEVSTADNYDHNYQYDGSMWFDYAGTNSTTVKGANVFTASANADGAEELSAVSFEAGAVNASYDIQIYKNLTNLNNPESGELCATTSGYVTFEGQYTAKLDTPVTLNQGDTYSVVVTLTSNTNSSVYLVVDAAYNYSGWFKTTTSADANESFLYSYGNWIDYGQQNDTNLRIKAYTNDAVATVTPDDGDREEDTTTPNGISLNTTMLDMTAGTRETLVATVTPENATDYVINWYSSDCDVAVVEEGVVIALAPGTTYITAMVGDYYDVCMVNVVAAETDDGSSDDGSSDDGSSDDGSSDDDSSDDGSSDDSSSDDGSSDDGSSGNNWWDNSWNNNDWNNNDWGNNDWGNNDWGNNDWGNNDWGNNDWGNNDWGNNDWGNNDWGNNDWSNNNWWNNSWTNSWGSWY